MADRTSAGIFSDIFTDLAKGKVTKAKKAAALKHWASVAGYDFSPCQMDCDAALVKLGLARPGIDPEWDEEIMLYGPADE